MKSGEKMDAGRETRVHIGIYGACNAGKSTLANFITGSDASIVSPIEGTTTDIVRRRYEIADWGPVLLLDTAGTDDTSPLGAERTDRTLATIPEIDLALLIFRHWSYREEHLAELFVRHGVPFVTICNETADEVCACTDNSNDTPAGCDTGRGAGPDIVLNLASASEAGHGQLMELIKNRVPHEAVEGVRMFKGRVFSGDAVILVCPVDAGAPAGRLILPQVQAMRELLDMNAVAIVVQPPELEIAMERFPDPKLVVCDSQVYAMVRERVPRNIAVEGFSTLLAAAKGDMALYEQGLLKADDLRDGDRILIAESCLHQTSCDDIGRVKIPRMLEKYSGRKLQFDFASGLLPLPANLADYVLVVQCGGCMATRRQIQARCRAVSAAGVAITNYGMLIRKTGMK